MTFKGSYTIRFSKQFEKNTAQLIWKTLVFPHFPNPNFKPIFSLRFSARDVSIAYYNCLLMNERTRFGRQMTFCKIYHKLFNGKK